jgi:hypothetical protein
MEAAGAIGMQFIHLGDSDPAPRSGSAYMEQLRQGLPFAIDDDANGPESCGACASARDRSDGRLFCEARRLVVARDLVCCEMHCPASAANTLSR